MKNLTLQLSFLLTLLLIGCNSNNPKDIIMKDLNSRFTKFELVEVKEDSANVYKAINTLRSLEVRTSIINVEIIRTLNKIENSTSEKEKHMNYLHVDSIHNSLTELLEKFEKSKYDKTDHCFYVKYLLHKEEQKIPKEEYYYIRPMPNGEYDIIHRPYDWDEFLSEYNYDSLLKEAMKYYGDIYDLELKYKK
jgi:hypothetical protein